MIPFSKPYLTHQELKNLEVVIREGHLSGDGKFTEKCHEVLRKILDCKAAFLTHSCTAALEMCAMLADVGPGDEVIMPSYTFVSTANAVVLRGGVPVFVDIRPDTLNIDENLIEAAITKKTKAIFPVHYAGVSCEMTVIRDVAQRNKLKVLEDAAQGLGATYANQPLGTIGDVGAISFHVTKNIISGEGGALIVNDEEMIARAEVIREKGTDRSSFFRGETDKYTWRDIGSSYLPSELIAAFLLPQLEQRCPITEKRLSIWKYYHDNLRFISNKDAFFRPGDEAGSYPDNTQHNGHIYYLIFEKPELMIKTMRNLKDSGFLAVTHYVPLHSSPAGARFGRTHGHLSVTERVAERLLRLPLFPDLSRQDQDKIIDIISNV